MNGKVVNWRLERTVSRDPVDLVVGAEVSVEVVGAAAALAADLEVAAEALPGVAEALEATLEGAGEEPLAPAVAALVGVMVEVTMPPHRLTSSRIMPLVGESVVRQFTSAM